MDQEDRDPHQTDIIQYIAHTDDVAFHPAGGPFLPSPASPPPSLGRYFSVDKRGRGWVSRGPRAALGMGGSHLCGSAGATGSEVRVLGWGGCLGAWARWWGQHGGPGGTMAPLQSLQGPGWHIRARCLRGLSGP